MTVIFSSIPLSLSYIMISPKMEARRGQGMASREPLLQPLPYACMRSAAEAGSKDAVCLAIEKGCKAEKQDDPTRLLLICCPPLEQSAAQATPQRRLGHVVEDKLGLEHSPQLAVGPVEVVLPAARRKPSLA
jgi:hypothetical protein